MHYFCRKCFAIFCAKGPLNANTNDASNDMHAKIRMKRDAKKTAPLSFVCCMNKIGRLVVVVADWNITLFEQEYFVITDSSSCGLYSESRIQVSYID